MSRKVKIILLLLLILIILFLIFNDIFGLSFSFNDLQSIKKTRIENKKLLTSLKINGVDCIYDKNEKVFYYNISDKYIGSKYVLNLNLDGYKYFFTNYRFNIIKVDYKKGIDVVIYNKKYYFKTKIIITNLPLISINAKDEISKYDVNSTFKYINNSSKQKIVDSNIKLHTRGSSSSIFEKKSYRINFYNDNFKKNSKLVIKDFYNGDSLILSSVYRDPSKIRDNLATKLWNDISNDFRTFDINSKFVELFINNEYKGLYVLTEPVNNSKVNFKSKFGIVIKTNSWQKPNPKDDFDTINSNLYAGFEIKYPNDVESYKKVWSSFLNRIIDYYDEDVINDYNVISNTFNMKNYIDIIIFNSFTNNVDCDMIKNLYFYMENENSLINIEPWDLEFTFGYLYDEKYINSGKEVDDADKIYLQIFSSDKKINELIIKRYKKLRKTILTNEYFDNLLDNYQNNLIYATKRDSKLWYEYDINDEIEKIRNWIHKRLIVMDKVMDEYE